MGYYTLYENNHFIFKILSKYIHQNASTVTCFQKFLHSKRVSKIFIFYIKNDIFRKIFKDKIGSKYTIKTHQIAPLKKNLGEHALEPPSKAHGFAMRCMSLRDMQISKSEEKNSCPPSQTLATPLPSIPNLCKKMCPSFWNCWIKISNIVVNKIKRFLIY